MFTSLADDTPACLTFFTLLYSERDSSFISLAAFGGKFITIRFLTLLDQCKVTYDCYTTCSALAFCFLKSLSLVISFGIVLLIEL